MEPETTTNSGNSQSPLPPTKQNSLGQSIWEWIKVIVIALIISLPIRFFIAEPFVVNGASMDPTFSTGQFLIVDRLTYRFEDPTRFDVIVFKYPNNPRVYYIKRIIGLPGETIVLNKGKVFITGPATPDGLELDEPYIESSHLSSDSLRFTLKDGEYFVMGDNRAQSSDSRIWGALDEGYIIGRPLLRILPFDLLPGQHNEHNNTN